MIQIEQDWFATWFNSPYYPLLYNNRNDAEAAAFLTKLVKAQGWLPGTKVLDIACGEGRHSRTLTKLGLDTTGIDLAPDAISKAQSMLMPNLQFAVHDLRETYLCNGYQVGVNLFTSFGYFGSDYEHQQALNAMVCNVEPGGTFVLDFFNATKVLANLVLEAEKVVDGIQFHMKKLVDDGFIYKQIVVEDGEHKFRFTERVKAYTIGHFRDMFAVAGCEITQTFGSYELEPFEQNASDRLIIVARRDD